LISNHIRSDKKTGLINRRSLLLSEASDTWSQSVTTISILRGLSYELLNIVLFI
jgi:hypothetical protein